MNAARALCAAGVLVAVVGLAGTPGAAKGEGPSSAVAVVGGQPVTPAELAAFLFRRQRESWLRAVDDLVDETIVVREADRLGIRVPGDAVREAVEKEAASREAELHRTFGEDVDLASEIRRAYETTVEGWKRDVLAPRLRRQLLLMRIVRLDTRRRPRLDVRVIVLGDRDRADRVLARLRQGADFALTALQESIDPTGKSGGVLPSVARGDLAWPDVEARLFAAADGDLVGPLRVDEEGRTTWHVYEVVGRTAPWTGTRGELVARLEEDLRRHPLERPEFERWRQRMRRDFAVRVFDPEGRLLAEPR